MDTIHIQHYKTKIGELILGSFDQKTSTTKKLFGRSPQQMEPTPLDSLFRVIGS